MPTRRQRRFVADTFGVRMAIETIRVSQEARQQLIKLKKWTRVQNWNVLCRWAFCTSLAEPSVPPDEKVPTDSNLEMTWRTFGGQHHELYMALLKERCVQDGLGTTDDVIAHQFKLHLHRGISYLAADRRLRDVGGLMNKLPSYP